MTDAADYPSCVHGRKVFEHCPTCLKDARAGRHGGFERAPQPAADTIAKPQGFPSSNERTPADLLGSILAIIHGDGGHYQAKHGDAKATEDAIAKYYATRFDALCPHGMPLADNICGPCSQGRPNRPAGETPAPCVWRDGCRNPPICVAKGCCHPPEMQRADSHDDLLRAVRYLIVCARTSGEKRDDGLCTALDRVESILQDRYCVTGCGEVSGVKFHSPNCPRSAVKTT